MVPETVPIGTDDDKEPSINSTRMLNIIAADQVGVMNLIIDAELKQNSESIVHDIRSSTSPSREIFRETHSSDHHGQGERTRLFLCPGDSNSTEWVHKFPTFARPNVLFPTSALEGGYSHNGWVTPLRWHQDTRVQMAQQNEQQKARRVAKALWSGNTNIPNGLELQYKTKSSMSSALTFQDGRPSPSQPRQEPHSLPQGKYSDQRSTQHPTHREDRDQDPDDKGSSEYPDSPPYPPDEQQTSSSDSNSMSTSDHDSSDVIRRASATHNTNAKGQEQHSDSDKSERQE
jgi:hypothetical protein